MYVCFATNNENKLIEIRRLLGDRFRVSGLADMGISEDIPETGATLEENSRIKAEYIFSKFHMAVFSDDSGLEVEALDGRPGVYSARFSGPEKDDQKNIDYLLELMDGISNRTARFRTVVTFIDESGETFMFEGIVRGRITSQPSGASGFGYDPVFIPEGHRRTFAEMSLTEKNKISHRARAVEKLIKHLKPSA